MSSRSERWFPRLFLWDKNVKILAQVPIMTAVPLQLEVRALLFETPCLEEIIRIGTGAIFALPLQQLLNAAHGCGAEFTLEGCIIFRNRLFAQVQVQKLVTQTCSEDNRGVHDGPSLRQLGLTRSIYAHRSW
jgi:hypothetical protein